MTPQWSNQSIDFKRPLKVVLVVVIVVRLFEAETSAPPQSPHTTTNIRTITRSTVMALESGTYINSLNASNPASTDGLGQADDHIRLLKSTIKSTFPNIDAAVTATEDNLNLLTSFSSASGTSADLNLLAGQAAGGLTSTELGYLKSVTSDIQAQLNAITVSASGNLATTDFAAANSGTGYGSLAYDNSGNYTYTRVTNSNIRGAFSAGTNISIDGNGVISSPTSSFTGGTGISISGSTITNSAPDQTVTLTGSGATSISGSYPNFTISSTDTDTNTTYTGGSGITVSGTTISADTTTTLGAVGTYAFLKFATSAGSTVSGSSLYYSDTNLNAGSSPSGTWRCMGHSTTSGATVFVRIS